MRICVLTHTFPRNNQDVAAAFMKEFCDGLVENGCEVIVVTPFDKSFLRSGDKFKVITYKYIWPESLHLLGYSRSMEADIAVRKLNYILLPFLLIFGFFALLKIVREQKTDLISVHWILPSGLIALCVSKITGVPFAVTLPGTDAYLAYKNRLFGFIAKIIAERSSALFSNSRWHLERILKLGVRAPIEEVITYPVDTEKFKPLKAQSQLRSELNLKNTIVLLAVGRLVYKKGFDYLIKALPQVLQKNKNVKLIIGGEGDLLNSWKELVAKLGLEKFVIFIGTLKRDEIVNYYNLADIMVTPSILDNEGNIDGRPLVILESMACGKPQIVTNLPGISDSLEDGINALLVPQKDPKALAQAIIKLSLSKELREKMGEENRILAVAKLSMRSVGEKYTHFFKKVLKID